MRQVQPTEFCFQRSWAKAILAFVNGMIHFWINNNLLFYHRALNGYRAAKHPYSEGDVLIRLGHLQALRKQYVQAISLLEQANALEEKMGQVAEVAQVGYELAFIFRRLNRPEDAISAIQRSIDIVEKQRVAISHFDSRASYFAAVHKYYTLYVQLLMLAHQKDPGLGFAEKAFDVSERSKVRSLLDLLTASSQDAPCDELLERQLETGSSTAVHTAAAEQTETASTPPTLTLKQVQAEIEGDDAVLLEYEADRAADRVPVRRMLALTAEAVRTRAAALASALASAAPALVADVRSGESAVGGGAAPAVGIPTALLALAHRSAGADRLAAALRAGEPHVIVRVAEDRVLVDLRTVEPADEPALLRALVAAAAVLGRAAV
jgi:tetratricopeptide (TPR) repeat protein